MRDGDNLNGTTALECTGWWTKFLYLSPPAAWIFISWSCVETVSIFPGDSSFSCHFPCSHLLFQHVLASIKSCCLGSNPAPWQGDDKKNILGWRSVGSLTGLLVSDKQHSLTSQEWQTTSLGWPDSQARAENPPDLDFHTMPRECHIISLPAICFCSHSTWHEGCWPRGWREKCFASSVSWPWHVGMHFPSASVVVQIIEMTVCFVFSFQEMRLSKFQSIPLIQAPALNKCKQVKLSKRLWD